MRAWAVRLGVSAAAGVLLGAGCAAGQGFETVGTRALGMGGAFVAVADDATAVYWNPAGLAYAALVDASVQRAGTEAPLRPGQAPATAGGWRASATLFSFAVPSLGVSYLRTRVLRASGPTAGSNDSRQTDRPGSAGVSSLATDQVGVTVLQSLLANLVVGTTLKLTRGAYAASEATPGSLSMAFDQAARLPATAATRFDLDVGVLGFAGPVRVGLTGRNLRQPDFGSGDPTGAGRLRRQARIGIAVTPGYVVNRTAASQPSLTIAVDADLTRSRLPAGEERHIAAGVEGWVAGRRVGIRGGARASTVGSGRPLATAGASLAVRRGLLLEAQVARGRDAAGQQWSVGGRVTF